MSPWVVAASIGTPLIVLFLLILRRVSRKINTIVKEEASDQATDNTPSEATAELVPIEAEDDEPNPDRDWARTFLADTYGLNPVYDAEDKDYRAFVSALYNNGDRPNKIRNAVLIRDITVVFTTAEILAKVLSDQELEGLVGSPTEAPVLWMLRREGRLPRWAPPLFDGTGLGRYHEELNRRRLQTIRPR